MIRALVVLAALAAADPASAASNAVPGTRDYLHLPLGANDEPAQVPYVWEREVGRKHLVVVGTMHSRDPHSPMFARIDALADRLQPQVVLHESTAPDGLAALPRDEAIAVGADIGYAAQLAVHHGAVLRSGDAPEHDEIAALLAAYPAGDVLVLLTAQRHIGNVKHPDFAAAARDYPAFFADYLAANGMPRRPGWDTWAGFLLEYRRVVGEPLTTRTWRPLRMSAVHDAGRLGEMARATNAYRDRCLLEAIRRALREHDRVLVVFGSWHVLALEPVLAGTLPSANP